MKQFILITLTILVGYQSIAQDTVKITQLTPVLVTGVRADKKTPVTQKTIGDTSIQETYQGQEVPILLSSLPSMYSNSDGGHSQGYTYVSMRGASQNRINMTLNGVPLNEPEDHGVYTSNVPGFINGISSIQIQRGVGTSSNGAASFIGSINFQSKNGFRKGTEIQIGGGSFNTFRVNASKSSGLNGNYASFVNISGITTDGFRKNSGSDGGSIFYTGGYYGDKQITKLVFFSGFSKNRMAWEGSDEQILKNDFRDNPRGNDDKDFFLQTHVQFHNINLFNKHNKLTTTLFYNRLDGNYDVYNKQSLSDLGYYAQENQYSNWFGYVGQYDYKAPDVNFTLGASLNRYQRYHNGIEFYSVTDSFKYKNHGTKNEASGFAKLNYGPENLKMFVDIQARYVDFDYVDANVSFKKKSWLFINPKFGVKTFIQKNFDFYMSISMSHREPTRSVLFNNGFYLTDLNNIKSEKVIDIELGVNYISEKIALQANFYSMSFDNEIIPAGPLGPNSLPTMINVENSSRNGFEFDVDYRFLTGLTYSVMGSLSDSRFGSFNKRQLFSPNMIINHSLSYTNGPVSANINQSIYSKSYIDIENNFSVPACSTLGVNLSYTYKNYKLTLQGNNITNNRYYFNGYAVNGKRFLFPNALSNYFVTLRFNF